MTSLSPRAGVPLVGALAASGPASPLPAPRPVGRLRAVPSGRAVPDRHPKRVSLGLLDDQELLLESFATWIGENAPEFEVVVTATSWTALVAHPRFPTDVVMMDIELTQPVSLEARVRACRAAGSKVMVVTGQDTERNRVRAQRSGAMACLSKARPPADLIAVARAVAGIGRPPQGIRSTRRDPEVIRPELSPGELTALLHYVEGLTMEETAGRMGVKYETVKTFLRRVREKYGRVGRPTSTRADLIARATEDGHLS